MREPAALSGSKVGGVTRATPSTGSPHQYAGRPRGDVEGRREDKGERVKKRLMEGGARDGERERE